MTTERDGDEATPPRDVAPPSRAAHLVVALGASAGGLAPLEGFFSHVPPGSGLSFIVVTHQHPTQPSLLAELLARRTTMPVVEVATDTVIAPDHVYTSAPGTSLSIAGNTLVPAPIDAGTRVPLPIDHLFRSLAAACKERAVGIVLSGTGSDGALGLKAINDALGMVMVQDERSAQYQAMPHNAIAAARVDHVLPVDAMPAELIAYAERLATSRGSIAATIKPEDLARLFALIRSQTRHDFSQYKASTVMRRIERRMNVHRVESLARYVHYLEGNPAEIDLLFKELLIGVTAFFRDPEGFAALAECVQRIVADKAEDYVVRAWVAGCSTGEEAYSIAIVFREVLERLRRTLEVQIFATDLDADAVNVARSGVYPLGIAHDVSQERLGRFFTFDGDGYRIRKEVREMVVFAQQNLIADPPFTKLDLLSCRNVLIYLDAKLQRRLMPIFHYALRPGGVLFLGPSETVGAGELFDPIDKKRKLYVRREVPGGYVAQLSALPAATEPRRLGAEIGGASTLLSQHIDRLLRDLLPPTVLIRERGDVLHIHGRTGLFLEPAPGAQSSANIFNMARPGLGVALSVAMRQAATEDREVIQHGIGVKSNGHTTLVDLRVQRVREPEALRGLFRITFEAHAPPSASAPDSSPADAGAVVRGDLERALRDSKESHQGTIEELETANEELKSTNEELQSTNEELQSANEELGTSKEEMQSLNEELQTVNAELQGKIDEVSRANNDLKNLLDGTDIATIFLDDELRIRRFTVRAKNVIRVIPSDVGRPIADLVSLVRYDRLVEDAREVLQTLVYRETEVQGPGDVWYLVRILPYRTTENVIDGLVVTFVEVTKIRRLQQEQRRLLEALANSPTTVFGHDRELRFTWALGPVFGRPPAELVGRTLTELVGERVAAPILALEQRALESGTEVRGTVRLDLDGQPRVYDLYVEPVCSSSGVVTGVGCVATDVTIHVGGDR